MFSLEVDCFDLVGKLMVCRDFMRVVVLDWEVVESVWILCVNGLNFLDVNDVYVLVVVFVGYVDCIVIVNLKDFLVEILGLLGIEVVYLD